MTDISPKMNSAEFGRKQRLAVVVIGVILFVLGFLVGYFAAPTKKNSLDLPTTEEKRRDEMRKKSKYHSILYMGLNKTKIGENVKYFSMRPHDPGTARSQELALEIANTWKKYNFDKVEMPRYNVLLPVPDPNISNKVQILDVQNHTVLEFSGRKKPTHPSEAEETIIQPFLAYAKQGSASGKLLYVNYGRTEDFDVLKKNFSIPNCDGYIVIMRYDKIFRGDKVKNARKCGAVGAILYNDPADFATEGQDKVYPKGIWLPKTGVQQGSLLGVYGDPLTPGLPAIDGIFRISPEDANLPKIPATVLPYGEVIEIMKIMQGHEVPKGWKGTLNITYRIGNEGLKGNNSVARIEVNFHNKRQDIYNVIGTIYGKEEPDRWVMIGNHRDAWGFGAVDPSSGTGSMMEISRGLGMLLKQGWRPRRTIKFCSWGAEEAGLIGSNEWVEEHQRALSTKGVAYINIDVAVAGTVKLIVNGSPMFETFIAETTKNVTVPDGSASGKQKTTYDEIVKAFNITDGPILDTLSSDSDYASFYQYVGVPSLDMFYFGKKMYPVYHSIYDTYKWLQGLVDPDFSYHLTTTQVATRALMSTSDNIILPMDVRQFAKSLQISFQELNQTHGAELHSNNVTLHYIKKAIERFKITSLKFHKELDDAIGMKSEIGLRDLNDRMVNVEKSFIYDLGLPKQKHIRHLLYGPPLNYVSTSFPGINDLMFLRNKTTEDWIEIRRQVSIVFKSIISATEVLEKDALS